MAEGDNVFHPVDSLGDAIRAAGILGTTGFAVSAVQNALQRQNVGMLGVFTRSGSNVLTFALSAGGYAFAKGAAANLRRKNDTYNEAIGGFVGGALAGLKYRTLPMVLGLGAGFSIALSAFDYTGGRLMGYTQDPNEDGFEKKVALRTNRRRPIEETISELGEGRGIYGPGYEERRRERIKQAYGIDVGPNGRGVDEAVTPQ